MAVFPVGTGWLGNVSNKASASLSTKSFVSQVACAAHEKVADGRITVPDIRLTIDCGFPANPERIEGQMQGAAVTGRSVALGSGIPFENGAVVQSTSNNRDVVRSDNCQSVTTHIAPRPYPVHTTGVGEPGALPVPSAISGWIAGRSLRCPKLHAG